MRLITPVNSDLLCLKCGFELWEPIADSPETILGLYNDARFPGRCILKLKKHYEHIETLPSPVANGLMKDIQYAAKAIKAATDADRVNVAILGNSVSHIHAHIIPRFPDQEPYPNRSPWDDTRAKTMMDKAEVAYLKERIRYHLDKG